MVTVVFKGLVYFLKCLSAHWVYAKIILEIIIVFHASIFFNIFLKSNYTQKDLIIQKTAISKIVILGGPTSTSVCKHRLKPIHFEAPKTLQLTQFVYRIVGLAADSALLKQIVSFTIISYVTVMSIQLFKSSMEM